MNWLLMSGGSHFCEVLEVVVAVVFNTLSGRDCGDSVHNIYTFALKEFG